MAEKENSIVLHTGGNYLVPAAPIDTVLASYQAKKNFIDRVLREGVDFGSIPGAGKPALLKAGAEKMASFFALSPTFEDVSAEEDWDGLNHGGEAFFYYRQKCKLFLGDRLIASADGSCNSREIKYRYRWISEQDIPQGVNKNNLKMTDGRISEFGFAIDKAETTGKYGKPAAYWQQFKDAISNGTATKIKKKSKNAEYDAWEIGAPLYRIPNPDIADLVNTILKMAQKRALVAAVLIATNASDYFTQDVDDFIEGSFRQVAPDQKGDAGAESESSATSSVHEPVMVMPEGITAEQYAKACENTNANRVRLDALTDDELREGAKSLAGQIETAKTDASKTKLQKFIEAIDIVLAVRNANKPA